MGLIELPKIKKRKKNKFDDFVFSSKVRISRNIEGIKFPIIMNEEEKKKVEISLINIIKNNFKNVIIDSIDKLDKEKVILYLTNKIFSPEFLRNGNSFIYEENQEWIILINEDDHIKLFSIESGYNIKNIYEKISQIIDKLENYIDFAFDEKYGYLTSSVLNIGTGLKISCLLNLYGLVATKQIEYIINSASKIGFIIQNINHENQDSTLFYVFNIFTLGESEKEIINEYENFIDKLYNLEIEARNNFFSKKEEIDILFEEIYELNSINNIDWNNSLYYISLLDILNKKYIKINDIEYMRKMIYFLDEKYISYYYNEKGENINKIRASLLKDFIKIVKFIDKNKFSSY